VKINKVSVNRVVTDGFILRSIWFNTATDYSVKQ
jgi:hypothetical protein